MKRKFIMLVVFYTSILSYMIYFSFFVAPLINNVLDREINSKLLRKIFPMNFFYGCVLSFLCIIFSILVKDIVS